MRTRFIASFIIFFSLLALPASAASGRPAVSQAPELILKEAQTVYFGNIARQQNGVPPLRWNKQLTDAARWFAWDSVEIGVPLRLNRSASFALGPLLGRSRAMRPGYKRNLREKAFRSASTCPVWTAAPIEET